MSNTIERHRETLEKWAESDLPLSEEVQYILDQEDE